MTLAILALAMLIAAPFATRLADRAEQQEWSERLGGRRL